MYVASQSINQVGFGAKTVSDIDPLKIMAFKKPFSFSSSTGYLGQFSNFSNFGLLAHVTADISLFGA